MSARLDPENGAVVDAALAAWGEAEGLDRAQALTRIAEIALAALTAGEAPTLRGDQLAAIQVQVTVEDLPAQEAPAETAPTADTAPIADTGQPRSAERGGFHRPAGRIRGGPGLPRRVLDRLLCIGRVQTVLMDPNRRPLDVGRNNRVVSRRVFQALLLRDGGCAHPGCGSLVGVEAHHVRYWRHGGLTVMANLVLLCRRHHHAQHEGEFEIEALGQGRFRFRRVDGIELPGVVAPHPAGGATALEADHAHVATDEATTGWDGTRSNLSYAVSVLAPGLKTVGRSFDPWAA